MYCPSCGAESTIELNYCNRCGANLSAPLLPAQVAPISVTKPILIIGVVMLFLTLGGFAGVLSTAIDVADKAGKDLSGAVVFFGMITILTIDVLLFTLLMKLVNAALSSTGVAKRKQKPQHQARLASPATAKLQPAPSVTENTTRFFDTDVAKPLADPVPAKKFER